MSSHLPFKQTTNVERRTWDKETYEARAKARTKAAEQAESADPRSRGNGGPAHSSAGSAATSCSSGTEGADAKRPLALDDDIEKEEFQRAAPGAAGPALSQRAYLKARRDKVDLWEGKVGTSEIVGPDAGAVTGGSGVDSDVKITDGVSKSGVGWHCKVCDCYLKDSHTYLDHINGRKHQRALGYSMRIEKVSADAVSGRLATLAKAKNEHLTKRSAALTSGGGGRRKEDEEGDEFEDMVRKKDEEALRRKAERARRREERKRKEQEEEEDEEGQGLDPDMAAMMGFSGFGGGNKNR